MEMETRSPVVAMIRAKLPVPPKVLQAWQAGNAASRAGRPMEPPHAHVTEAERLSWVDGWLSGPGGRRAAT